MPTATERQIRRKDFAYEGTFLCTAEGGRLRLGKGHVTYTFYFRILEEHREEDILESVVHIADADGAVCEARSSWPTSDLILQAGGHTHRDWGIAPGLLLPAAGSKWESAFEHAMLVSGCRSYMDPRFYRPLLVGDTRYLIRMKHQNPTLDLAAAPEFEGSEAGGVVARVSGYFHDTPDDCLEVPAFIFEVNYEQGLFLHRYRRFRQDFWEESFFPRPALFHRTDLMAEPQNTVISECRT